IKHFPSSCPSHHNVILRINALKVLFLFILQEKLPFVKQKNRATRQFFDAKSKLSRLRRLKVLHSLRNFKDFEKNPKSP
ncbi:MAG: hypothetical protein RR075_04760, partial [Pygmaiobacter sp.]